MNRVGVQERDLEAEETLPRLLVDQLDSPLGELVDRRPDVGHLVGDVVHARTAFGQKLAHGCLFAERRQQLDPALADLQRSGLDALVGNGLAMLEASAEDLLVGRHRRVEVLDRDAEMMDPAGLHAGDATCGARLDRCGESSASRRAATRRP